MRDAAQAFGPGGVLLCGVPVPASALRAWTRRPRSTPRQGGLTEAPTGQTHLRQGLKRLSILGNGMVSRM